MTDSNRNAAALIEQLRSPRLLHPAIRLWWALVLWLASNVVVLVCGQLLLPQALTASAINSDSTSSTVGAAGLVLLALCHAAYWRRFAHHVQAESALYDQLSAMFDGDLVVRQAFPGATGAVRGAGSLFGFGVGVVMLAGLIVVEAVHGFSSARSIESPLLALLYAAFTVMPFGAAMMVLGVTRRRLPELRAALL